MTIEWVLVGLLFQAYVPVLLIILLLGSHPVPVKKVLFLDMREQIENNAVLLFTITILSSTCGERTNNNNFNKVY